MSPPAPATSRPRPAARTVPSGAPRIFVGRQPVLDRARRIAGYEILFRARADSTCAEFSDQSEAAARVIVNTFMSLGTSAVIGEGDGFVNVSAPILRSDLIEALPAERVVIEVLETVPCSDSTAERCRRLRELGFRLALDDYVPGDPREPLLPFADIAKVDVARVRPADLAGVVRGLRRRGVTLLAEKVETPEQFRRCFELGFELFQGYFFARPEVLGGASLDPARSVLIELLKKLHGDVETAEIADSFKRHVDLGVKLLQLVNSAAMARPARIDSVEHAVNYVGRRQLTRWMMILLFAGVEAGGFQSPLLQTAAYRGRLMELLSPEVCAGDTAAQGRDAAFLAGMLSLADAILQRPVEEIVRELCLGDQVAGALLERAGTLGTLLSLVERLEAADFEGVERCLDLLAIPFDPFATAEQRAYEWIHDLAR